MHKKYKFGTLQNYTVLSRCDAARQNQTPDALSVGATQLHARSTTESKSTSFTLIFTF